MTAAAAAASRGAATTEDLEQGRMAARAAVRRMAARNMVAVCGVCRLIQLRREGRGGGVETVGEAGDGDGW